MPILVNNIPPVPVAAQLITQGWFPSGTPWTWYIGKDAGNSGITASLSYEGGNQITSTFDVPFTLSPTPAFADLLGINRLITPSQLNAVGNTVTQRGDVVSAGVIVWHMASTAAIQAGYSVEGDGVQDGTTVTTVDSATQVSLSLPTTATVTGGEYTFSFPRDVELQRIPPMQHPYLRQLYCSRITDARPMQFLGKRAFGGGINAPFYKWWRITALFSQPKWNRTIGDNDLIRLFGTPKNEWERFTTYTYRPSLATIARLGKTYKWAEGPGKNNGPNNSFASTTSQLLAKADVLLIWHRVPKYNALFSSLTGRPTNIESCIGKLNDRSFLNYPKGTLRLNPPEIIELEDPVPWEQLNINPQLGQTSVMCDVVFPFSFWDPPPGSDTRGHNLMPFGDASTPGDGKWYLATLNGTVDDGKGLYNYADMKKLFRLPG